MMMIGKELLRGLWVCPECLSWFAITSHLRSVSLSVSLSFHHFSCHTALSLLTTKWYIVSCHARMAGGSPGFRIALCCFTHNPCMAMLVMLLFWSCFVYRHTQYGDDSMWSPPFLRFDVVELASRSLSFSGARFLFVCWWFCVFGLCLFCLRFLCPF